jgi:hypothetical protein
MKIAFAFMVGAFHGERRRLYVETIRPRWQAEGIGGVEIFDNHQDGCWHTCKRAWCTLIELAKSDAEITHCAVLQDDFLPCDCFLRELTAFIARSPARSPLCILQPAGLDMFDVRALMGQRQTL